MKILKANRDLETMQTSIGSMLLANQESRGKAAGFAQKEQGRYRYWSWQQLVDDIVSFAVFLESLDLQSEAGDTPRIAMISSNGYQRLVAEMAVMSCGLISVPIFCVTEHC